MVAKIAVHGIKSVTRRSDHFSE